MFSFSIHFLLYFHSPEIFLGNVTIPLIRTVQGVAKKMLCILKDHEITNHIVLIR